MYDTPNFFLIKRKIFSLLAWATIVGKRSGQGDDRNACIEFLFCNCLGVIRVVDELDYETKKDYELTVRATDGVTGVYAEVLVNVIVEDVNDCPPEFSQDLYNVSVSEATPFGTSVFRVTIRDNDTGEYQNGQNSLPSHVFYFVIFTFILFQE